MTARCAKPIPFETLSALWTGDLGPDEALVAEEHLFACDECAAASDRFAKLVGALREAIPPVVSHAHRERLARAGTRLGITIVAPSTKADAYFKRDVDLLIHVLRADLSRAERVDVEVVRPDGVVRLKFEHVPFDAKAGEVLIACQRHYQALTPEGDPTFRVHAIDASGERQISEYLVIHHFE
jgi:hypothetical protein